MTIKTASDRCKNAIIRHDAMASSPRKEMNHDAG